MERKCKKCDGKGEYTNALGFTMTCEPCNGTGVIQQDGNKSIKMGKCELCGKEANDKEDIVVPAKYYHQECCNKHNDEVARDCGMVKKNKEWRCIKWVKEYLVGKNYRK